MDRLFFAYRRFIRIYINDIIVFSTNAEKHMEYLYVVLGILDKVRVHINAEKIFVDFLAVCLFGYNVDGNGIFKIDDRINIFKKLIFLNTFDLLEIYLGMAIWLRKEIAWYNVKVIAFERKKVKLLTKLKELGILPIKTSK